MLRSMFTAVSALRNHQTYMNVIGNNVANVNTTAFKSGRITFQDILNQTLRGSSSPTQTRGGVNPAQLGLGMTLGAIDMMFAQGDLQPTGRTTDLAIQGDGFFVLSDGTRQVYTRDGAFDVDSHGYLGSPVSGLRLQGWQAVNGALDITGPVGDLVIPLAQLLSQPTGEAIASGNLSADALPGETSSTTLVVYDSLGASHNITLTFTRNAAANTWDWEATTTDPAVTLGTRTGQIVFTGTGLVQTGELGRLTLTYNNGAVAQEVDLDLSNVTQLAQSSAVDFSAQDGTPPGALLGFAISPSGEITGTYSNGLTQRLGQVALAQFANPGGLSRAGGNLFEISASSGQPVIGAPGSSGRGVVASGALEMSNVDLAQQFTNLIMAQRGFQANSRVITTSDELLQDLISMKR